MFTGIIQEVGRVTNVRHVGGGIHLTVTGPLCARELNVNDSISVNGVCQTVIGKADDTFEMEAVEETLRKTTLGELRPGDAVDLELPVRLSDRLGGHLVQGHVDGVGVIEAIVKQESSWLITVRFPAEFSKYVIPVGSIAIDGVSLTVASVNGNALVVSIIPHTLTHTILADARPGRRVNLEFDLVGKYIEKLINSGAQRENGGALTDDKLKEWGY